MITLLNSLSTSRYLVIYVLVISLVRGIVLPDFRYDTVSIFLIQVVYPIALFAPMVMAPLRDKYWRYYFLCVGGIVFATLLALFTYYLEAGKENVTDQVSVAIFVISFIAQIVFYSTLAVVLFLITKVKRRN